MRVVLPSVLLLLPALASALDVQGPLPAADTVWKKSLSPYVLTGDVTVPWGARLTVEAGVQIIAVPEDALHSGVDPERVEFIVDGTLVVRGTASQPVEFTSHGQPGSWYGVRVRGGRGTVIEGARLDQATQGISLGMSAVVKNSSVSALAAQCIQETFETSSLQNNDMSGCGGRASAPIARPLAPTEPAPPLPAPRERPAVPPLTETRSPEVPLQRAPTRDTPAPMLSRPPPSSPLSSPGGSECAIEPQVREPPECPGIRQWRKNQERLGEVAPGSTRALEPRPKATATSVPATDRAGRLTPVANPPRPDPARRPSRF